MVVAGNLFWGLVGWLSISGPSSGTPSEVVTRAMFGVRGNRVFNVAARSGWSASPTRRSTCRSARWWPALIAQWGGNAGTPVKVLVVLATALVTFTISVYGHATIVKLSGWFTWILLACTVQGDVLRHALGVSGSRPPRRHGGALWGVAAAGFNDHRLVAAVVGTGADYARLPAARRPAARGDLRGRRWRFLPAVAPGGLGVLAGTVVDMTNPYRSGSLLPGWFTRVPAGHRGRGDYRGQRAHVSTGTVRAAGVGIPCSGSVTVIFDAVVAISITCYALFISDFLNTLNNILALTVAFLGPAFAIYGIDILLRRNRYDGLDLHDETPGAGSGTGAG